MPSADIAKARTKAKEDIEKSKEPSISHPDSSVRKAYFDVFFTLRTEKNLAHIIEKYGPLK